IITQFNDLSEFQKAQYVTYLDLETNKAEYITIFEPNNETWRKSKLTYHAGNLRAPEAEPEQRENICHVYLPPLRDVQRELESSDGHRLSRVIEMLSTPSDTDQLM